MNQAREVQTHILFFSFLFFSFFSFFLFYFIYKLCLILLKFWHSIVRGSSSSSCNATSVISLQSSTSVPSYFAHLPSPRSSLDLTWQLILHGANLQTRRIYGNDSLGASMTTSELANDLGPLVKTAFLHFWTPADHWRFPKWIKDAIIWYVNFVTFPLAPLSSALLLRR